MNIHKTAIVDKGAKLADDVEIGPYTIIDGNVNIGAGTKIASHCVINEFTTIGKNCRIFPGAVLGGISQDKKFKEKKSFLEIGDNNIIREYTTMNRATEENGKTIIGNNNFFMAYAHIAHNCHVKNNIIIANCGTLGGHVILENGVIIGGLGGIHQFVRVGELAIIGGHSKAVQDIVPYSMSDGHPAKVYGINSLGLERAGFSQKAKDNLKKAFKILFFMKLNIRSALKRISEEIPQSKEITDLINFIKSSERGISR